jgi:hypothetical protein
MNRPVPRKTTQRGLAPVSEPWARPGISAKGRGRSLAGDDQNTGSNGENGDKNAELAEAEPEGAREADDDQVGGKEEHAEIFGIHGLLLSVGVLRAEAEAPADCSGLSATCHQEDKAGDQRDGADDGGNGDCVGFVRGDLKGAEVHDLLLGGVVEALVCEGKDADGNEQDSED